MNEWNIQSRAHHCQNCTKPFVDRQPYHTLLYDERADFVRVDVCAPCWEQQYQESVSRKGFISHWQGIYEAPPPAPPEPIQKDTAETLLRKVVELGDLKYRAVAFILAVMLERKRLLKVKEQLHREGVRLFVYEQPKTGDLFTIADPNLQLNQLEAVQREVADLLEHGLPTAGGEPGSPEAVPAAADPQTAASGEGDPQPMAAEREL